VRFSVDGFRRPSCIVETTKPYGSAAFRTLVKAAAELARSIRKDGAGASKCCIPAASRSRRRVRETYHIEATGFETSDSRAEVVQRVSVRSDNLDSVTERAMRLFQRLRAPQRQGPKVEAVRVLNGAGMEVFRWSVWNELTKSAAR